MKNSEFTKVPPGELVAQLMTIAEAAGKLRVSPHTVRSWIAHRRLTAVRLGRSVRLPATEVQRIIDEGATPIYKRDEDC